jgi:hypothetical protein
LEYIVVGTGANGAPTGTVTINAGSRILPTVTANGSDQIEPASLQGLFPGMVVSGAGIPAATTILSIDSVDGTVTISANATADAADAALTYAYSIGAAGTPTQTIVGATGALRLLLILDRATAIWKAYKWQAS